MLNRAINGFRPQKPRPKPKTILFFPEDFARVSREFIHHRAARNLSKESILS